VRKVNRERATVRAGSADRSFGVQTVPGAGNVPLDVVLTSRVGTYIKHQLTNAVAEGLNSKIQALKSAARGFRNIQNYRFTENLPAR